MDEITLFRMIQAGSVEIPLTAWEQIAVVCIFVVLLISIGTLVFGWVSKQQQQWIDFSQDESAKNRMAQAEMNDQWRATVSEINDSTQRWLSEQSARECASMDKVTAALDKLSNKLDAHDDKVDDRISRAVSSITKRSGKVQ